MGLVERISEDLTRSMKDRDAFRTGVLRMVKSALKNREIEKRAPLVDDEAVSVLKSLLKQRMESIEQFEAGGRKDLADKERQEKTLIEGYLPEGVTPEEMAETIRDVIRDLAASSPKDVGRVMKETLARLAGTGKVVDGKQVNEIVRSRLQG